jgi:crotonobetainyl-CoA:carnitine CoA-transferase CaiB-like acyl-CoA transferase
MLRELCVVDLSRALAGPYGAYLLVDFDAEVVRMKGLWGNKNCDWFAMPMS